MGLVGASDPDREGFLLTIYQALGSAAPIRDKAHPPPATLQPGGAAPARNTAPPTPACAFDQALHSRRTLPLPTGSHAAVRQMRVDVVSAADGTEGVGCAQTNVLAFMEGQLCCHTASANVLIDSALANLLVSARLPLSSSTPHLSFCTCYELVACLEDRFAP